MNAPQHSIHSICRGLSSALTIALSVGCTAQYDELEDPADRWSDAAELDELEAAEDLADSIEHQTSEQAHDTDVQLAAEQLGLSESLVAQKLEFQRDFADYAGRLAARYPERIEAIWLEPLPEVGGHIRFVGEVPIGAEPDDAERTRLGTGRVEVSGGGTASWHDHVRHAELAALALADAGHTNHLTYYDPASGRVVVEMKRPAGDRAPDRATVTRLVEDRIVEATYSGDPRLGLASREEISGALDIDLVVETAEGPIFELELGRGGNIVRDDGVFECTSGWSVIGPDGFGILTAGHCTGINQLLETNGTVLDLSWEDQVNGAAGDVEYHSSVLPTLAEFYATASTIRDVNEYWTGFQIWPFPPVLYTGDSVCQYGRASNSRSCNKTITATGVSATFTDGVTRGNLVQTNNHTGVGGDSGGGWSWGNTAYGTHVGGAPGGDSYFTPLVVAVDELGVVILTQ